jgi:hypothetical protein
MAIMSFQLPATGFQRQVEPDSEARSSELGIGLAGSRKLAAGNREL